MTSSWDYFSCGERNHPQLKLAHDRISVFFSLMVIRDWTLRISKMLRCAWQFHGSSLSPSQEHLSSMPETNRLAKLKSLLKMATPSFHRFGRNRSGR